MKTSYTFLKKNKALLILPLALLPFVVLIFYILGGGENAGSKTGSEKIKPGKTTGANYELPEADKSIEIFDKMEAYNQEKEKVTVTRDYNITSEVPPENTEVDTIAPEGTIEALDDYPKSRINANVSNNLLTHIKNKELQVRKELEGDNGERVGEPKAPVEKLTTRQKINQTETTQKTGIEELDKVFDENINLNRQNDSLNYYLAVANRKLKELESRKLASFNLEKDSGQSFDGNPSASSLIKAEVYETCTVLSGNRVKMRLLESCLVDGKIISKNTFIYGICQIKNERLNIHISQIPVQSSFLPVELSIYDLDGLKGLYVPDNAARKVAKEVGSSTNTSSLFGITTDPLTYAGVRAADKTAQSLFKMVRQKKVTIKKNTLIYLINQK